MSESGLSLSEEILSPDIFSEANTTLSDNNPINSDASSSTSDVIEPEPTDDTSAWKGISMDELRKGQGIYDWQELPPISPSSSHTVLILLPIPAHGPPKPYPSHQVDKWCQGYVRMPYSVHSVYPINKDSGSRACRNRWEIIQKALLQSFVSSHQLETAILSYNHIYAQRWDFTALHHFFSEVLDEEEANTFYGKLLPKMVQLALQLPVLLTGPLPLLKQHTNKTISLSQLQVASLLANAFFCTFPRRNSTNPQSEYSSYPYINFNRLYSAFKTASASRRQSVIEKLKCLFHYFRRVTSKAPEGVITIQRRYIPKHDCPKWERQEKKLPLLHITSKGTIELDGAGLLQVDFANKYLGGGVLGLGCVQEEIRFAICPELLVTMLVTEVLDDTEALIISGIERYSKYEGYSNTFKWMGDYLDETPRDNSGRRRTSIVAIDALYFKHETAQFSLSNITRELNKAYVGFIGCDSNKNNLPAVATGNWGCGAFHGNPKLKVLLQLMAAAVAGRSIVYFTFGDTKLRDDIANMYWHLVEHNVDTAHLFSILVRYQEFAPSGALNFYRFVYNQCKVKPISRYCSRTTITAESKTYSKQSSADDMFSWNKQKAFKKSQSFQSTPSIKTHETEEERIQSWLAAMEDEAMKSDSVETPKDKCNTFKDLLGEYTGSTSEISKSNQSLVDFNTEKKKKCSFWRNSDNKAQSNSTCEQRVTGLESLGVKQDPVSSQSTIADDCNKIIKASKTEQLVLDMENEPCSYMAIERRTEKRTEPCTRDSPVKRTSQKKISDFFQRTS